jgi:hypothetical protein
LTPSDGLLPGLQSRPSVRIHLAPPASLQFSGFSHQLREKRVFGRSPTLQVRDDRALSWSSCRRSLHAAADLRSGAIRLEPNVASSIAEITVCRSSRMLWARGQKLFQLSLTLHLAQIRRASQRPSRHFRHIRAGQCFESLESAGNHRDPT